MVRGLREKDQIVNVLQVAKNQKVSSLHEYCDDLSMNTLHVYHAFPIQWLNSLQIALCEELVLFLLLIHCLCFNPFSIGNCPFRWRDFLPSKFTEVPRFSTSQKFKFDKVQETGKIDN